jgi:hypothetical protein
MAAVNIEEFYEADPRRRRSEELEFGIEWTEGTTRCSVAWIATTGELYLMREPYGAVGGSGIGDTWVSDVPTDQLVVEPLGVIEGKDAVEAVMSGWPDAMMQPNSIEWVRSRVANAASEMADPPAQPSEDLDGY